MDSNKDSISKLSQDILREESFTNAIHDSTRSETKSNISYEISKEESSKNLKSSVPDNSKEESLRTSLEDLKPQHPLPNTSNYESEDRTGGEWNLLLNKLIDWFKKQDPKDQAERLLQASKALLILISTIIFIGTYQSILKGLSVLPLAPSLFELIGVIWLMKFSIQKIILKQDQENVLPELTKTLSFLRLYEEKRS